MSKFLFYPGCSMERSARPYLDSLMAIRKDINMEFDEVKDWNCCGATEYISISRLPSFALIGRNLALAAKQANGNNTLVAPCSACYLNLAKTDEYMGKDNQLNQQVNEALAAGNLQYNPGDVEIRHLLDIVYNDIGLDAIRDKVVKPLQGLRVAPYYGCMLSRPDPQNRFGSHDQPQGMDELLKALGAEVVDFPLKAHCCGGHMTQISAPTAYELIRRLIHTAEQAGADIIATVCPMCQLNLDAYQGDMNQHFETNYHTPVVYFTQLMGLAFGHTKDELGLGKEFINPDKALSKIGTEKPKEAAPKRKRRSKKPAGLPMPPALKEMEVGQ